MKHVIHIFGASGSGTSTLGKALAGSMGLFFMDSDDYYWLPADVPFTAKRSPEDRVRLMQADIDSHSGAVISGSLTGWGDPLMPAFTLAIRLVTDTDTRLERIRQREYARFGERIRADGDMAQAHQAFLQWAAQYDTGDESMRSRRHHDLWQEKLACPLLTLDGTLPVEELVRMVRRRLLQQPLSLRPAEAGEEEKLLQLYRSMIGTPYCTWNEQYPTMTDILLDMQGCGLYVLTDESNILGTVSVVPENELDELSCWSIRNGCR